jgi:Ca2+-dependent lipid-binding protein
LDSYLSSLRFTTAHLGTVPPVIVAVKYCQTEENCARLDLDIKWAGNPQIGLSLGSSQQSLLEISDITFTGLLRLELGPLFPRFPCFGAIDMTFLEQPFIDFSLKAVSVNLMNLGIDDLNMTGLLPPSFPPSPVFSLLSELVLLPSPLCLPLFPAHLSPLTRVLPCPPPCQHW